MDFPFNVGGTVLETPRLRLRAWREDDLDDFFAYASVDGVGEMAGWRHHTNREVSKVILSDFISEDCVFALELKQTGRVIGSLGVHPVQNCGAAELDALPVREIGYVLGRDWWGRGLMPEAVQAVIAHVFANTPARALLCCHFSDNPQSRRVIEKCGFRYLKSVETPMPRLGEGVIKTVVSYCLLALCEGEYKATGVKPDAEG